MIASSMKKLGHKAGIVATVAVCAIFAAFQTPSANAAEEYKFLVSWSPGVQGPDAAIKIINAELEKISQGEIKLKRLGPEVVPPFEQLEPVSAGSFDMLYTHPAYHGGATGIGMMLDTVNGDPERRRKSGIWEWVDRYYQEDHNLKILAITATTGFHILLREPLGENGSLDGRKIRSNPAYDAMIKTLGGIPVTLPVPQIFTALQKGLVDGTAFPVNSMVGRKFYEVVKYMVRPSFGRATNFWMINLDKWKALDPETQETLLAVGQTLEQSVQWQAEKIKLQEAQGMIEKGAGYTYLAPENAIRIEDLFNQGVWNRGISVSGDKAREFLKLIKEKDMAAG